MSTDEETTDPELVEFIETFPWDSIWLRASLSTLMDSRERNWKNSLLDNHTWHTPVTDTQHTRQQMRHRLVFLSSLLNTVNIHLQIEHSAAFYKHPHKSRGLVISTQVPSVLHPPVNHDAYLNVLRRRYWALYVSNCLRSKYLEITTDFLIMKIICNTSHRSKSPDCYPLSWIRLIVRKANKSETQQWQNYKWDDAWLNSAMENTGHQEQLVLEA